MDLHVMTCNLRFADYDETSPHSWPRRRPVLAELLRQEAPHVVGTQEGLYGQLRDVHADLGAPYEWIGTGRDGGSRGEFMAVFYDGARLEPCEYEHFWLAPEPRLTGAKWPGAGSPRMVTWVRFRDLSAGGEFYLLNTHLDNASEEARTAGARLLVEQTQRPGGSLPPFDPSLPRVVTGDFNAPAERGAGGAYDLLLDEGGLTDAWTAAPAGTRGAAHRTWHDYGGAAPGPRIDWILTTPGVSTVSAKINTFSPGVRYPSDHFPVQAVLRIG